DENIIDIPTFFQIHRDLINKIIQNGVNLHQNLKVQLQLSIEYRKNNIDGGFESKIFDDLYSFKSIIYHNTIDAVNEMDLIRYFMNRNEKIEMTGSAWQFYRIKNVRIKMQKYTIATGSTYEPLPKEIQMKRACVNVQNKDNKCFIWSILSGLYPVEKHSERVSKYQEYFDKLDTSMLTFPVEVDEKTLRKFEAANNLGINVIDYYQTRKEYTHLFKAGREYDKVVNLLLSGNHYCFIKNLSRLFSTTKFNNNTKHFCNYCFNNFTSEELLEKHHTDDRCRDENYIHEIFPKEDKNKIFFRSWKNTMRHPAVFYFDTEATLIKTPDGSDHHVMNSLGIIGTTQFKEFDFVKKYMYFEGSVNEIIKNLFDYLDECYSKIRDVLDNTIEMDISAFEQRQFELSQKCYCCHGKFNEKRIKVRDHCHITGEYRGAACNFCNLQLYNEKNKNFKIQLFAHNLKGYDAHHIIKELAEQGGHDIDLIPQNTEKYLTFSVDKKYCFKDSMSFLQGSIEKIAFSLKDDDYVVTNELFGKNSNYMKQKGLYPYEWVNDTEKLNETMLPNIQAFLSKLNPITTDKEFNDLEKNYIYARKIWNVFKCKTFRDYHKLYLKSDVSLLADIFETFRDMSIENYGLDPVHYVSSPSLSWDSMLKSTRVTLELFTEDQTDMYLMVEKGIRGGISQISTRHSVANNKDCPNFDAKGESIKYISYTDANNLYGWSMSKPLPTGDFKWVAETEFLRNKNDLKIGHILEVDIQYPEYLHDLHSDYPLAPEHVTVTDEQLSEYQRQLKGELNIKGAPTNKLLLTLYDKEKYVVHSDVLDFYLSQGLVVTKVHRILQFRQSTFLKKYIDLNTGLRKQATEVNDKFGMDFFKLMNNSVFGKTMENVRNRIDFRLVNSKEAMDKTVRMFNFKTPIVFGEELVGVQLHKKKVMLNKPIAIGFCILDYSKMHMYDMYYNYYKTTYGDNVKLLMTDTDSFLLEIKTDDVLADMNDRKELFDMSVMGKDHMYYDDTNKKVIGKFSSETGAKPITEFVGIRSKMYAYNVYDSNSDTTKKHAKAKGIKKNFVEKNLHVKNYVDCLKNEEITNANFIAFKSKKHSVFTFEQHKRALVPFDDKRYYLNAFKSLPHGHYKNK
ncbi:unnamed protein product, partial [Heterosigma akashiwo]